MTLLWAAACLSITGQLRADDIDLSAVPPFLLKGVAPNLVLTLDNSDSMKAAYLPSGMSTYRNKAVFTSADLNAVYYDPAKTYLPGLDADGQSLGNADFSAAESFPYLGCAPGVTVDLASDYVVARWLGYGNSCPAGSEYSSNPAAAAFYHLYDPDNWYNTDPTSNKVCNSAAESALEGGTAGAVCHRCGDDFDGPVKTTPDACFDRVRVGSAADLLIAACTDVPDGTAGITAQDTYVQNGGYSDGTALTLTNRIDGETCEPRTDDSALGADDAAIAQTNFANWYRYHRTRLLVAKTALSRVMQTLSPDVRLAYQGMRFGEMWEASSGAYADLAATFDTYGASKASFYQWMAGLHTTSMGTVLGTSHVRSAEFVASELAQADDIDAQRDGTEAYADNSCGIQCRNNFHLMFTDGGWEDKWGDDELGGVGFLSYWPCEGGGSGCWIKNNQDGENADLPANNYGLDYSAGADAVQVFADENVGMLADVVFHYWRTDLDGDASNNRVPPILESWNGSASADTADNFWNPKNDPATWQHLSFYAVGLGIDGAVTPSASSPWGTYTIAGDTFTLVDDGFPDGDPSPYTVQDQPFEVLTGPFTAVGGLSWNDLLDWYYYEWLPAPADNKPVWYGQFNASRIPYETKIDDLYHATLNGRGRYFNASDAQELIDSFADVLDTVSSAAEPTASNTGVAISTRVLDSTTLKVQSIFDATTWQGELRAYQVSTGIGRDPCAGRQRGALCQTGDSTYWTAPVEGQTASERLIITLADGSPALFARDTFDDLSRAQQLGLLACGPETDDVWSGDKAYCNVGVDLATDYPEQVTLAKDRIDYLRGDPADEDNDTGFRERGGHWLGDIVGSNAVVVGPPSRVFSDADYIAWRNESAQANRGSVVYVGANDGMLHAFDAADGEELFAYVPESIYPHLSDLTDPEYGTTTPKRAYVDGPIASGDAKFSNDGTAAGSWHTVLVGSLGLGAQGVYALDITAPGTVSASTLANLPLWELNDASGSDADDGALDGRDMGYSLAPPAIVRIDDDLSDDADPTWVALVSNGYNNTNAGGEVPGDCTDAEESGTNCTVSQTGDAVLYVLRMGGADSGRILARMDTGHGFCQDPKVAADPLPSGNACAEADRGRTNGLGPVTPVDPDGDLIADAAYAGDLFGNLWRFDLIDTSNPPVLVFHAEDDTGVPQPITGAVAVRRHPRGTGLLVLFGTGQYLNADDKSDTQVQSFYAIWDDFGLVFPAAGGGYVAPARGDLLEQEFETEATVQQPGGGVASLGRSSTDNLIDWSAQRGWYVDLKLSGGADEGERVIHKPSLLQERVLFVSMTPEDCCASGGTSWINALDASNGSRLADTPFDYNGDGSFSGDDELTVVNDDGTTETVTGSSIRDMADGGTGIYSELTLLGLGGGVVQLNSSDSEADLRDPNAPSGDDSRTWIQLR